MRTGKISENVLKRSVLKRCKSRSEKVAQGPAVGQDCAIVRSEGQIYTVLHTQSFTAEQTEKIRYEIIGGVNNLCCAGTDAVSMVMAVMLPAAAEEEQLREIMDIADATCQECGIQLAGGHTEVSDAVHRPVITITVQGFSKVINSKKENQKELELVMAGFPGLEGTALLTRKNEEELKRRFPLELVDNAMHFDSSLLMKDAAAIGWECGAQAMHDVSQGGIFGALWEFCERDGIGLEADLRKIPIRQETIEICEVFGWNPYQLLSGGCLLMTAPDGQKIADRLQAAGICARVIGRTTTKKEKVLHNGEEMRYLDKPAQDQIMFLNECEGKEKSQS